ncbi:MAG: hypothetical protein NUW37_06935 [Planctomycetes bacterium]|nr:hypothetical protein [Planctomycetota bacterium]
MEFPTDGPVKMRVTRGGIKDTDPEIEMLQIEMMRKASSVRKFEMMCQMYDFVRNLGLSGIRKRHPDASEAELRRRLADLLLGKDLARTVYGPPESKGE